MDPAPATRVSAPPVQSTRIEDTGKLLLRLAVGGLMLFHGIQKALHGIDMIHGAVAAHGLPDFVSYGVYFGEVVGPVLVLLGFLNRVGGLIIAFNMIMSVYLALADKIFALDPHGSWAIELNAFYFLTALALAFLGAGRYSLSRGRWPWD